MDEQTQTPECPTRCAQCGRALLWRRPWRHHCESCTPIMRGVDAILAGRQVGRRRTPRTQPLEGPARDRRRRPG